jgi:CheY-like chemotaxis protein
MLISLGYTVLLASDGQEAIDQLLAHDSSIDAILMDQSMPIKDGVTATREIRELEVKRTVKRRPIIAVTAVVSTQAQALFKEAGADDFLAKPLSLGRLEKTLGEHLPGQWR